MSEDLKLLIELLGKERVKIDEFMSSHTTFRIGGPADLYFGVKTAEDLKKALKACSGLGVGYFILGIGANLLVGDKGIRGLTIKMNNSFMEIVDCPNTQGKVVVRREQSHYKSFDTSQYLRFDDLELVEPEADTFVRVGAGASLPVLISWTLDQGLTGLQNFAGIPASVGGAVYNNIHGGTKLLDQFISRVTLLDRAGVIKEVDHHESGFSYDRSRIQKSGEIVVDVLFKLSHGDAKKAKWVRQEWLRRKLKAQPQKNCPGCIFKNLTVEDAQRIDSPTVSAGWVLDVGLGLKGTKIGGVSISRNHANFFVNDGSGKAWEVLDLIRLCKAKAQEKFSLNLVEEIQTVGEF